MPPLSSKRTTPAAVAGGTVQLEAGMMTGGDRESFATHVIEEVRRWPGVELRPHASATTPGESDGVEFRLYGRQIGHVHSDCSVHLSLTKALKSPQFQLLSKKKYQMSWSGSDGHTRPCTHSTQRDGDRRQGQANATRAQCAAGMD